MAKRPARTRTKTRSTAVKSRAPKARPRGLSKAGKAASSAKRAKASAARKKKAASARAKRSGATPAAKSKARTKGGAAARRSAVAKKSTKTTKKKAAKTAAASTRKAAPTRTPRTVRQAAKPATSAQRRRRARQAEIDDLRLPTPPSSLDMNRHGSAARTGREEMAEERADHRTMTPSITGGDVDADVEDAYFTGDEAPGGDNPTPDQDVVDEIGRALGVEYQDSEELRGSEKVSDRDRHRWELDPASAEDYRDRR
jgi:hypothetical protein